MPYPTVRPSSLLLWVLITGLSIALAIAFALECMIIFLIWSGAIPRELLTP